MKHYFAPALIARFVVAAAGEAGVPAHKLLARAGMTGEEIDKASVAIPHTMLTKLLAEATRLTGNEAFALRILPTRKLEDFDILAFAAYSHPTCHEVIKRSIHALNAGCNMLRDSLRVEGGTARWITEFPGSPTEGLRQFLELRATMKQTIVWRATGINPEPLHVGFRHAAPPYAQEYENVFQAQVRFNHPHCEFVFSADRLILPCVHADPQMQAVLDGYANSFLARFPNKRQSLADSVGELIAAQMSEGLPTVQSISHQLGLKTRTLQHRLKADGIPFGEILESRRREASAAKLGEGKDSIINVALSLGFSNATTFGRAFKKWFGVTPREYRVGRRGLEDSPAGA